MALVSGGQLKGLVNKYARDTSVTKAITYKSIAVSYADAEMTEMVTQISARGIVAKYNKSEVMNSSGAIQEGDIYVLITAKYFEDVSVTPTVKDRMTIGSIDWEILDVPDKIDVGSTGLMYEFHCRR